MFKFIRPIVIAALMSSLPAISMAQDAPVNADGKLDMEALLAEAKAKRDASAVEAERTTLEAERKTLEAERKTLEAQQKTEAAEASTAIRIAAKKVLENDDIESSSNDADLFALPEVKKPSLADAMASAKQRADAAEQRADAAEQRVEAAEEAAKSLEELASGKK